MSERLPYTHDQIRLLILDADEALEAVRFKSSLTLTNDAEWHEVYLAAQDAQAVVARITKALVEMADSNVRVGFLNEEKQDPLDDPTHVRHIDPNVHNSTVKEQS